LPPRDWILPDKKPEEFQLRATAAKPGTRDPFEVLETSIQTAAIQMKVLCKIPQWGPHWDSIHVSRPEVPGSIHGIPNSFLRKI